VDIKDKVVLVTGSGQGIGAAIATAMARAGARLVSADINLAAARATADTVAGLGAEVLALQADVGEVSEIDAMIDAAVAEFGRLDVIVNNAGVTRRAYIMDLTEADWDRIHRVNAKGVFFCLQRAARAMIGQGGGCIINIASTAAARASAVLTARFFAVTSRLRSTSGVIVKPGQIALTLILCRPSCWAAVLVSAITAPLLAA